MSDDHYVKTTEYSYIEFERFRRPGTQLLLPANMTAAGVKRFVILMPAESFSVVDFMFRVNQYTPPGMALLFVTRVANPDQEMVARHQLILVENMIRSPLIQVQSQIAVHQPWMKIIKEIWREGDLIICLEAHQDPRFLFQMTSLGRKIFSAYQFPVLLHQGIPLWDRPAHQKTLREILAWLLFLGTIGLFSYLQVQVDQSIHDWVGQLLLCITLVVEFFLILKINEFFN
ncbi:MAG: hypothetical protein AAGU05_00535 [Anaerolineaceae bacterium]